MSRSLIRALLDQDWTDEYRWLCKQRAHYPANADVWHLRFHWPLVRQGLIHDLGNGTYRFEPLQVITKATGEVIHLWSARDALVLKRLARLLPPLLGLSNRCTHVKHHGGLKATVANAQRRLTAYRYVVRTDIKGYYEHIDHSVLLQQLDTLIKDRLVMNLLTQVIGRCVCRGGTYRDIRKGISRGCPLSPILGALYLKGVDEHFAAVSAVSGLHYVRYMDDLLILCQRRWQLRGALKQLYGLLEPLKLTLHPDKTFIGPIQRGFDFLGYHFSRQPLRLACITVWRFKARLRQLYEQQQTAPDQGAAVLGNYVTRWRRWATAGLDGIELLLASTSSQTHAEQTQT